jgi:AcrR family transcriptional regulator
MPPPPRSTPSDRANKRDQLIASAAQVFAQRGYNQATMDQIAQAAGTAKGTLYLYFEDKESLFYATFEWLTEQTIAHSADAQRADLPTAERLQALAEGTANMLAENREWFPLTLDVWSAAGSNQSKERFATALREMYTQYRALIAGIVRDGQARGELRADLDAEALGAVLIGALDGLLLQCWFDPKLDPLPLIQAFFDPLLRGMRAEPGETS